MNYLQALAGGVVIGLASWLLLAGIGRVSGISNILSGALAPGAEPRSWRWLFLLGLVGGGWLFSSLGSLAGPVMRSPGLLIVAGLLVGLGTVIGSGCTSGHGVCGLGRRSPRSLAAVLVFMATGALTVWLTRVLPA